MSVHIFSINYWNQYTKSDQTGHFLFWLSCEVGEMSRLSDSHLYAPLYYLYYQYYILILHSSSSQVISHWAAFSGCGRNAPRRPKGSRRRWDVAESRRHQEVMKLNILSLSLFFSQCGVTAEKHWSAEKLYGEQRCSFSSTRSEVRENDLVLPRMKEPFIWSHTGCACGRHYYSRASHVTLLFSLLSGTSISHFIYVSMHSTAEVDRRFVSLLQLCTEMVL